MSKHKPTRSPAASYQKIVYWSDEDQCFIGQCPALFHGGVHGDDEAKVYRELIQVVEEHLDNIRADGKDLPPGDLHAYSGKLTLRLDPILHRALSLRALANGDSLNHHIERTLAGSLASS